MIAYQAGMPAPGSAERPVGMGRTVAVEGRNGVLVQVHVAAGRGGLGEGVEALAASRRDGLLRQVAACWRRPCFMPALGVEHSQCTCTRTFQCTGIQQKSRCCKS